MQIYRSAQFGLKKIINISFGFGEREGQKEKDGCVCYLPQHRKSVKVLQSTAHSLTCALTKILCKKHSD